MELNTPADSIRRHEILKAKDNESFQSPMLIQQEL